MYSACPVTLEASIFGRGTHSSFPRLRTASDIRHKARILSKHTRVAITRFAPVIQLLFKGKIFTLTKNVYEVLKS